jgi:NAD kinase
MVLRLHAVYSPLEGLPGPLPTHALCLRRQRYQRRPAGATQTGGPLWRCTPEQAELIVALGGDGFMLRTLHDRALDVPVYGMKLGRVGFPDEQARSTTCRTHRARAHRLAVSAADAGTDAAARSIRALAFNEVSLLRQSNQAAHLEVKLNGIVKLDTLVCDGILVSTPAGSTAYNLSAHGPILPLDANVLALTPISPFRPRRWRGAILPHRTEVVLVCSIRTSVRSAPRPISTKCATYARWR